MKTEIDILVLVERISSVQLRHWIEEDWVRPVRSGGEALFSEADIARIRLIDTLVHELEVGQEAVPIILSLIDQVHDLRNEMRRLAEAIDAHPGDLRASLRTLLETSD